MFRRYRYIFLTIAVCSVLVWLVILWDNHLTSDNVMTIDVGNEPPFIADGETRLFRNFFAFYSSEQWEGRSFRWTDARGTVVLPAMLRATPRLLEITACGCRPDATIVPVALSLNAIHIPTFEATTQWRTYQILMPPELHHPTHDLIVDIQVPTWRDASDRTLGLALDSIAVRRLAQTYNANLLSIALVLVGIGVTMWWQRTSSSATLRLLLSVLMVLVWAIGTLMYTPQLLHPVVLVGILVMGLLIMWLGIPGAPTWFSLLAAALTLWLVLSPQILGYWLIDDAYISFQYARSFAHGDGLVFNPGERVEGYTNFLWTIIIATAMIAGANPVTVSVALTLVLSFGIVALTVALSRKLIPWRWLWVAPLLLVTSSPFLLYTTRGSGMETALFAMLILAALLALTRHSWGTAGVLTALTMLTRPDGIILAGTGMLYACWIGWQDVVRGGMAIPDIRRRVVQVCRPCLRYGIVLACLFLPYFFWRWTYYGYVFPNTFYVKVGGSWAQYVRGVRYLWESGSRYLLPYTGVAGCVAGIWLSRKHALNRTIPTTIVLLGGFIALFSVYIVIVGGDWMPGARFVVPLVPLLAICTTWGLTTMATYRPQMAVVVVALVLVLVGGAGARVFSESSFIPNSPIWRENHVVWSYRETGWWINANTPPTTTIAALAGATTYYANRPAIDLLGLADVHIAHLPSPDVGTGKPGHEKTDPAYVLRRQPDIIVRGGAPLLYEHPDFVRYYAYKEYDGPEGQAVKMYVRKKDE